MTDKARPLDAMKIAAKRRKAARAAQLADDIEAAYTKRPTGTGTKIPIEQDDWPLMIEALRLCEAMLEHEAEHGYVE